MKRLAMAAYFLLAGAMVCADVPWTYAQTPASSSASKSSKSVSVKKKKRHSRRGPKQMAPTPDRIEEIQGALATNGYYTGTPNGKWDTTTTSALQKFQRDHGLDATGKLDALSLQKLGLGSEIAGVSAPRPVKPIPANPAPGGAAPATAKPQNPAAPASPTAGTSPATPASTAASSPSMPRTTPPQPQ